MSARRREAACMFRRIVLPASCRDPPPTRAVRPVHRLKAVSRTFSTATPMIVSYLLSSGSLAMASLAQLATFAILARALGPAEFGLFVQISAVTAIAVQICGLGASDCLLRRVSREHASYPILLGHNLVLIGLTGAVLVFGGVVTMSSWAPFHSGPDLDVW